MTAQQHGCPICGARNLVYDDTFSYKCQHCSRMVKVEREEIEDTTSLFVIKKKTKVEVEFEPEFLEADEESAVSEDFYA